MVVPQSPQKKVSMFSPESAFLVHDLGLPEVISKPWLGMTRLVL